MKETILNVLKRHEGYRQFPYKCPAGKLTVAYGRNLNDVGISEPEAMHLLTNDMIEAFRYLTIIFPNFFTPAFSINRRKALTSMVINLGSASFAGFKKMIAAIRDDNWEETAIQAQDSKWYGQVGLRSVEIVKWLREG